MPAGRNLLRAMPRAQEARRGNGGLPAGDCHFGEPHGHLPGLRIDDPKNGSRNASEWPTGSKQKHLQTLMISPFWSDAEQCKVPLKQAVAAPLDF